MKEPKDRQFERSYQVNGTVLIVTIWVVLVLAGLALVFARSMRVAAIVAANHVASLEAECIAGGASEYIIAQLTTGTEDQTTTLMDSEPYKAIQVGQSYFWVLRSNLEDDEEFDYGLTDEAGKINLNGILDDHENDADNSDPPDNRNGRLEPGFYDYVTVYSVEANVDSKGNQRLNINDPAARGQLESVLQEVVTEERSLEIMSLIPTRPSFDNVLDFYFRTALTFEEFAQIADRLTTSDEDTLPGLVSVNTASKEVLLCLPGLEEKDADAMLSYRDGNEQLNSIAWVTKVLDQEKATAIGSYITVRSFQYSADIVCLSGNGRAYKRYKAVFDTQDGAPRIVYWKSLTHSGWPLGREIVATLRKGQTLTKAIIGMN